jgi:inosine-uridine nucleoside N-ribohydrolase
MIIETDMGNDIDDALALALALRAVDNGQAELLAVGCHKNCPTAAAYTDAVCTFYGHPEIPVAMSLTPVQEFSDYVDYSATEKDFVKSATEYPEPVALYRKILAAQPDGSVTFVSLGFGTTLAQLLESAPDEYSPLGGTELVARKTRGLSIMAGSYGEKKRSEYNVRNDIPAMQKVFEKWPTTIWQNPFEIGKQTMYPGALIEENLGYYEPNPVVEGYKAYKQMPYDRPSWDILSVLYPLRPELFTHSEKGTVTVDDEGYTWFTPSKDGKHFVLSATLDQPREMTDAIKEMTYKKN